MEVKMPTELVEQLDEYAKQQECTRTEVVELCITEWFEMMKKEIPQD